MASENERNDISLCFQALGIEFGASPDEVEKAYQKMLAEIKRKQGSANPAERAEAANDLILAQDLYEKIKNSSIYSTRMKEMQQSQSLKSDAKKEQVKQFKICPSCSKTINVTYKKCPYCREEILSPSEQLVNQLLSLKAIVILLVLVALIGGVVYLVKPDLFQGKPASPPPPASTGSFSNQSSSSFTNLTGATQKP